MKIYRFDQVAQTLHTFIWDEYCSWYLEIAKIQLASPELSPEQKDAVRHTLTTILDNSLRLLHVGIVPSSENLPDGAANKPGDVVTSMSGKTIEILNTDAEGRLILCDVVNDVVHYCVANMPGGVPRTSTYALNNVTLPHILTLADYGFREALKADSHLRNGLNVHDGQVTNAEVAVDLGYNYVEPLSVLG